MTLRPHLLTGLLFALCLPARAAGPSYLLLDHDPAFLEQIARYSTEVRSEGRIRLVELTVAPEALPAALAAKLRPISASEIYRGAGSGVAVKAADPDVLAVLSRVNQNRLMGYAEAVTMTGKRSAGQLDISPASGNRAAMDYIQEAFKGMGYAVERQCYKDRKADKECNIIARRTGSGARAIAVVGHMDSVGHENAGADDNASGAAGVLEMAKVLSGFKSDHDLIFICANGEENGIAGTNALARKFSASGEMARIAWAINMDMISYNKDGIIDIETNKEHAAHADWLAGLVRAYTRQQPFITMPAWGSDHVPFLEAGVPTYLSIEHWDNHNPCYHRSCDKLEGLDWAYAADIVKLNLAMIAGKARLTPLN